MENEFLKNFRTSMGQLPILKSVDVRLANLSQPGSKEKILNAINGNPAIKSMLATNSWYCCDFRDPTDISEVVITKFDRISHRIKSYKITDDG